MYIHVPFDEAVLRLQRSRGLVLEHLLLLTESMEAEILVENPLRREGFKRLLTEVFVTKPEWSRELAESMAYNITSVRQWYLSPSCPHSALWPQIITWLKARIETAMHSC